MTNPTLLLTHRRHGYYNLKNSEEWWNNGTLHREDGPAIIWKHHHEIEYWVNGERHREDGPAIIYRDGSEWYLQGNLVYNDDKDYTYMFKLSDEMKRSIIKYKLERMS